jgi:hypothetical protein
MTRVESPAVHEPATPQPSAKPESTLRCSTASPPCFFARVCAQRAAMEKAGRSVCNGCATRVRGLEYPLRDPSIQPLYLTGRSLSESLDMVEDERPANLGERGCLEANLTRLQNRTNPVHEPEQRNESGWQ